MKKQQVAIETTQRIDYADHPHVDDFFHESVGELIELHSFSRLTYDDQFKNSIEVKWNSPGTIVEVKQPRTTLRFNKQTMTGCEYQTPQGNLLMDVLTQSIKWEQKGPLTRLKIHYQLLVDGEPIGDYFFQLLYKV